MADIDFRAIIEIDSEINKIQDLDLLLERLLFEARKVAKADAGSIYTRQTLENKTEKLQFRYPQNDTIQKTLPPGKKMPYSVFSVDINEQSIAGYCALTEKMVNIPDMYHIPDDAPYSFNASFDAITGYKTVSTLTFPLATADRLLLGVIQLINKLDEQGNAIPFTEEDEFLLTHFAANATIALQRASVTRAMILRMIKMAELRDPKETGAHVNRVAGYAVEMYDRWALKHAIPDAERNQFRDILKISAMLHDVGKVAISDNILKKPSRFTPEEFSIMQNHTVYGAGLFDDPQSPIDIISRDIALNHHENWDGTGYPGWKKGEDIPFAGRIVAIADVFDALCSRRVYKEAWDEDQALEEIKKLSGTKFDPELVAIFFDIFPNIKQAQSLYPPEE